MPEPPYAWLGDVQTFLGTSEEEIFRELTRFARETGAPQLFAWDRSLGVLRRELTTCLPGAAGFALVLEFELPRSGGRRPDLIVLENGTVLVIEFKNRVEGEPADLDQIRGCVRFVCWGPDLTWSGSGWLTPKGRSRQIRDPRRLRLNAYRVLLTRGRDGVVVFVPPTPAPAIDTTFEALRQAGFRTFE